MYKIHHELTNTDIIFPEAPHSDSINVVEMGHSYPYAGYKSMQLKRNVYVIHYILRGKGMFCGMPVEAPCGFLMTPDTIQEYSVDIDPALGGWEQYWIMFGGDIAAELLKNAGFSLDSHVFKIKKIERERAIFARMFEISSYVEQNDGLHMLSVLFDLLSLRSSSDGTAPANRYSPYVKGALTYIRDFYALDLCEDDIANAVHISTKYLHKLFKAEVGKPPMKYLNAYRIRHAKKLLITGNYPISKIASLVGFPDPNYFCRVFQRFNNGVSPLQYRKNNLQQINNTSEVDQ